MNGLSPAAARPMAEVFGRLHLTVLQRDWLSSNQSVFCGPEGTTVAVVDTGYDSHSGHTVALLEHQLQGRPLELVANTHLHSDHCGGNAALQERWPQVRTWVPEGAYAAARHWDEDRLTFQLTQQTCRPFRVDGALRPGTELELGGKAWQVHATPGHDPDAVVLFEPQHRVLISGDALWRDRVAVIFPELDLAEGFEPALATLDLIERLQPQWVVPGHGAPFGEHSGDVSDALAGARRRLRRLRDDPAFHTRHAARVLLMFHMMEHRSKTAEAARAWFAGTPLARQAAVARDLGSDLQAVSREILDSLVADGALQLQGDRVCWAP